MASDDKMVCLMDASKREARHASAGYKKLFRRLKGLGLKVTNNKDDLSWSTLSRVDLLILGGPRENFTPTELEDLKRFVTEGKSLCVLSTGLEKNNVNDLLLDFGVSVRPDSVLRTAFYKYLHPKEVFISHGVLLPELVEKKSEAVKKGSQKPIIPKCYQSGKGSGIAFVYPHGSTLSVQRPARAVLSSGALSYPLNRCICAAFEGHKAPSTKNRPRVVAFGSVDVFCDDFIDKEENSVLADLTFMWLARNPKAPSFVSSHQSKENEKETAAKTSRNAPSPEDEHDDERLGAWELNGETHYSDNLDGGDAYQRIPDIAALASRFKPCLQEPEELPRDFRKMFRDDLFEFNMKIVPEVCELYKTLKVKKDTLSLIPPTFESPLPSLLPSTFPPALRELPPPPLDQFDLDEHFASSRERLAQLTNKCLPSGKVGTMEVDELEYYVREAGEIVGAVGRMKVNPSSFSGKHVLSYILKQVVRFKMVNPPDEDEDNQQQMRGASGQEPLVRRPGEEKTAEASTNHLSSIEPMKRRQQLTHLDGAAAQAKPPSHYSDEKDDKK